MAELEISASFSVDIPTEINEIISNCVIHFRPDQNWDGNNYGFDWVRIGDSNMSLDSHPVDHHYANLMGKYYGFGMVDTVLNVLGHTSTMKLQRYGVCDDPNKWERTTLGHPATFKNEISLYRDLVSRYFHRRLTISWKMGRPSICPAGLDADITTEIDKTQYLYYVPVMTLMDGNTANLKMLCELNPADPQPTQIEIKEKLEADEDPCFEYINGTNIKASPSNMMKYDLDIKCINTFSEEKLIEAYATYPDGTVKLCGQLRVLPNNDVIDLKILFISVGLRVDGRMRQTNLSNAETEHLRRILAQSMIRLISPPIVDFKITTTTAPIGIEGAIKNLLISTHSTDKYFPRKNHISDRAAGMISGAYEQHLRDSGQYEQYENYLKVFVVDILAQDPIYDSSGAYTGNMSQENGFTDEGNGAIILYKGREPETLPHEMMHVVGLPHPFTGKETHKNAQYTYKARMTENIVSYSHQLSPSVDRISSWQWQWQIARNFARNQVRKETKRTTNEAINRSRATMNQSIGQLKPPIPKL